MCGEERTYRCLFANDCVAHGPLVHLEGCFGENCWVEVSSVLRVFFFFSLPTFSSQNAFGAERLSTVLTIVGGGAVDIGIISVESLLRSGCLFGFGDDLVYPFGEGEGHGCRGYVAGGGNGAGEGSESHRGEGQSEEVDHLVDECYGGV